MARDYNAEARRRRRMRRRLRGYCRLALCAAAILLVSLVITKIIEAGSGPVEEQPASSTAAGISEILAPLPMEGGGTAAAAAVYGPVQQQAGGFTVLSRDSTTIRLPERGQVSLDYFSDAAFLGDSLTEGFTEYNINLSGALICGYVGIGPSQVVNRTAVTHPERGQEVALDVLAAAAPKKLYVLLGTNTLTTTGTEEQFLGYYSQMLDDLRSTLGPDTVIYVQSIPPVRPEVKNEASHAGLDNARLKTINESLAALADEKGCYYLDLWEVLADADGNLNADYAAADGIHFTASGGYTAWVNYLRSHTVYAADNEWVPGTAYAA